MFKRLKKMKDMLWALGIGLAILALSVGLVAASFLSYHGDRERPVMDLRPEKTEASESAADQADPISKSSGLQPDRTLHPLAETAWADDDYLGTLTLICDSSFAALRGSGLTDAAIWSSETGSLPMDAVEEWKIRYPGDGSLVSPSNAALVAKPAKLILAIGGDSSAGMRKETFIEKYSSLIRSLAKASPETRIVCLSLCSVTGAYAGEDGMTPDKAQEINGWIREICISTGAFYGELNSTLCLHNELRADYADGSGRALNSAGMSEFLKYLRFHSLDAQ